MNQRQLLLQAILDNPADDMARLVFADWLEENGEPERAEFIRVQVELEPLLYLLDTEEISSLQCPGNSWEYGLLVKAGRLRKRSQDLQTKLAKKKSLITSEISIVSYRTHRGFIAELTLSSADWFAHHAAILAEHPIERVNFTDWPEIAYRGNEIWLKAKPEFKTAVKIGDLSSDVVKTLLSEIWPRIAFEFPVGLLPYFTI